MNFISVFYFVNYKILKQFSFPSPKGRKIVLKFHQNYTF